MKSALVDALREQMNGIKLLLDSKVCCSLLCWPRVHLPRGLPTQVGTDEYENTKAAQLQHLGAVEEQLAVLSQSSHTTEEVRSFKHKFLVFIGSR